MGFAENFHEILLESNESNVSFIEIESLIGSVWNGGNIILTVHVSPPANTVQHFVQGDSARGTRNYTKIYQALFEEIS